MLDFLTEDFMSRFHDVLTDIKFELHRIADALEKQPEDTE